MKIRTLAAFTCTLALCASAGLAQTGTKPDQPAKPTDTKPTAQPKKDHPEHPAKPGDAKPAAKPSEGEAMMMQMMEKCMVAGTPGPMHEWLAKGAGTWEGKCTMYMPGMPPSESTCVTTITPMFEGRFVKGETVGEMGGQPFHGFMLAGYNNTTKKFEQTWIDSMGTMMMNSVGTVSDDKKTLTYTSNYTCPMTEKPTTTRMVETHTGDNAMTLQMFGPNPMDGKEMKMMEIKYTRKAETKPAAKDAPKTETKTGK